MAPIRKTTTRSRATLARVPRRKIPDRVQVSARVPIAALRAFDLAWQRACDTRPDPSLTRTDALLEAIQKRDADIPSVGDAKLTRWAIRDPHDGIALKLVEGLDGHDVASPVALAITACAEVTNPTGIRAT